ncbi:MAG: hypothetical protein AAFP76_02760 [Bacteroidota bacterium]
MRLITLGTVLVLWALALSNSYAQEEENNTLELLKISKEQVINSEKNALGREVEAINKRFDNNEITYTEAEELKKKAAEKHALNIENKLAIIDNKIALIERNGETEGRNIFGINIGTNEETGKTWFGIDIRDAPNRKRKYDRRTSSHFVFSFGLNNAIIEGQSLDDSPYKVAGSRYAEIGLSWSTRVFKESNWLRFKYGLSFQFNGLKPTDNRYFVDTGAQTELQEFPINLDKSKFRMDNLVVPVFFEMGPSNKVEREDYFRYNTHNKFKIGLGGYAGINLGARQKLKFDDDGESVKQKLKGSYNTNNFVYGLAAYVGWSDLSLYAKYDLNTIFKDNPVEQRNVSLGLRWDWD